MSHLPSVVDGLPQELTSAYTVPVVPLPMVFVPHWAPVQVPYSSASCWKPWPPSCIVAPGASVLPPENSIVVDPVFHQLEPLSMTACQSTVSVFGSALNAVLIADMLQLASRLVSSPQQPSALEAQIALVLTILTPQMLPKL